MSDLKPCPFCGGETANCEPIDSGPDSAWEVNCGSCQAYTWGETKDEAEAAWNRRVSNEKPAGEWDPNGTTPPPVELPLGMRWQKSTVEPGDWYVVEDTDTIVGYVVNIVTGPWGARVESKLGLRNDYDLPDCSTALAACLELAEALKEES